MLGIEIGFPNDPQELIINGWFMRNSFQSASPQSPGLPYFDPVVDHVGSEHVLPQAAAAFGYSCSRFSLQSLNISKTLQVFADCGTDL